MGACASCLGRGDREPYEEDEEHGLLYDDANGMQYGSFGEHGEHDTIETQREDEALQNVVAKTSKSAGPYLSSNVYIADEHSNMVDIFEIAPQDGVTRGGTSHFAYAGQGARLARYQHLVSKLNAEDESPPIGIKVGWLADDDEANRSTSVSLKTLEGDDGALVGTFADAAAAAASTTTTVSTATAR